MRTQPYQGSGVKYLPDVRSSVSPFELTFRPVTHHLAPRPAEPINQEELLRNIQESDYDWGPITGGGNTYSQGRFRVPLAAGQTKLIHTQIFPQESCNGVGITLDLPLDMNSLADPLLVGVSLWREVEEIVGYVDLKTGDGYNVQRTNSTSAIQTWNGEYGKIASTAPVKDIYLLWVGNFVTLAWRHTDGAYSEACRLTVDSGFSLAGADKNGQFEVCLFFQNTGSVAVTVPIKRLQVGKARGQGQQNHRLVKTIDGDTYMEKNEVFFVTSQSIYNNVQGYKFYGNGYLGVYALNMQSKVLRYCGAIYFDRPLGPYGDSYVGDGVGEILIDNKRGKAFLNMSTQGNAQLQAGLTEGTQIRVYETDQYILQGSHCLTNGRTLQMDNSTHFKYDSSMIYIEAEDLWYCTFAMKYNGEAGPYTTATYSSPDLLTWTKEWEDSRSVGDTEGQTIYRIGGLHYVFAAGRGSNPVRVLSLQTGTLIGEQIPPRPYVIGNPGHWCLVPYPEDGKQKYLLLTMDGPKGWIDVANEEGSGYEYGQQSSYAF